MSVTKVSHTPGPWDIAKQTDMGWRGLAVVAPGKLHIANLVFQLDDRELANAHLIAAAPEMLGALQDVVHECTCSLREKESGHLVSCFVPRIKEVIQKAKGDL